MAPRTIVDELLEGRSEEDTTMDPKTRFAAAALVFAIVGFLLSPQAPLGAAVWGPPAPTPGHDPPAGAALGALMMVGLVQAVGFGLGMALLLEGPGRLRALFATSGQARIAHLAIAWSLVSWVPHTALHVTGGADAAKLAVTEVVFHATLVVAMAALGWTLAKAAQERARQAPQAGALGRAAAATMTVVRRS